MKFVVGENGRNPVKKPTQTPFRLPRNPRGGTEMRTRDPSGERLTACAMRLPEDKIALQNASRCTNYNTLKMVKTPSQIVYQAQQCHMKRLEDVV